MAATSIRKLRSAPTRRGTRSTQTHISPHVQSSTCGPLIQHKSPDSEGVARSHAACLVGDGATPTMGIAGVAHDSAPKKTVGGDIDKHTGEHRQQSADLRLGSDLSGDKDIFETREERGPRRGWLARHGLRTDASPATSATVPTSVLRERAMDAGRLLHAAGHLRPRPEGRHSRATTGSLHLRKSGPEHRAAPLSKLKVPTAPQSTQGGGGSSRSHTAPSFQCPPEGE